MNWFLPLCFAVGMVLIQLLFFWSFCGLPLITTRNHVPHPQREKERTNISVSFQTAINCYVIRSEMQVTESKVTMTHYWAKKRDRWKVPKPLLSKIHNVSKEEAFCVSSP